MNDWEYMQLTVRVADLLHPHEQPDTHEMASRLSGAIIEAVNQQKTFAWEMVKMNFNGGDVTLEFRRASNA